MRTQALFSSLALCVSLTTSYACTGDPEDPKTLDLSNATDMRSVADMLGDMKLNDGTTTIVELQSTGDTPGCVSSRINSNTPLIVRGAVVTVGRRVLDEMSDGYYVSDGSQAPYSGVLIVVPNTLGVSLAVGDKVDIEGDRREIFCQTQLNATKLTKTGAATAPAPVELQNTLTPAELEQWEGVVVSFSGVSVTGLELRHARTNAGVLIDKALYPELALPAEGSTLKRLTGVITYSDGAYRLSPRAADDLVLGMPECAPQCEDRACGDDGCGKSCGSCGGGERCEADGAGAKCVNTFAGAYPEGRISLMTDGGTCACPLFPVIADNGAVRLQGASSGNAAPSCEVSFQGRPLKIFVSPALDPANALKVSPQGVITGGVSLQVEWAGAGSQITAGVDGTIAGDRRIGGRFTGLPKSVTLMRQSITIRSATFSSPR